MEKGELGRGRVKGRHPPPNSQASVVLKEITAGYASDPPGVSFYHQRLDTHGEPAFDEHGLPLYDCTRGTNDTECVHKQITTTCAWGAGGR